MKPVFSVLRDVYVFIGDIKRHYFSIGAKGRNPHWTQRKSPRKTACYLLIFFALFQYHVEGTSIAILYTPIQFVVGADSKNLGGDRDLLCKIFKTGSMYWAMSGMLGSPGTDYFVPDIVKKSYVPDRSVADMLRVFKRNALPLLILQLKVIRAAHPDLFQLVKNNPMDIAFWKFEKGVPVISHVQYIAKITKGQVDLQIFDEGVVDCGKEDCSMTKALILGVRNNILADVAINKFWGINLNQSARRFINLSISEDSRTVGPPINVLTIRNNGTYHWDEPNDVCHGGPYESVPPLQSVVVVK